jgi:NAD(P)-dependent dehydrogenase (short-subunit alcohol dehydrogenase family)
MMKERRDCVAPFFLCEFRHHNDGSFLVYRILPHDKLRPREMPMNAAGRAVLVTGATGTLGSEITRILAAREYSVFAGFARDEVSATQLQRETGCEIVRADIADEAQVAAMFESLPPLFAVVHLAGIARDEVFPKQSRQDWDETLRVNCDGAFLVARAALQKLESGGRLILFASRVGVRGRAGQTAYGASKAAQIALMKCAAIEGAPRRIAVNAICPGFVPSAMSERLSTRALQTAQSESVFDEFGSTAEVGALVELLLEENAAKISGQIFHCDSRL